MSMENHLTAKDVMFVNETYICQEKAQDVCHHKVGYYHNTEYWEKQMQRIEQYLMHSF